MSLDKTSAQQKKAGTRNVRKLESVARMQKKSEGCLNCYVYRIDERHDRDASQVFKTRSFKLPISKDRTGQYKVKSGSTVWTCFSGDFFLGEADDWRIDAWDEMRERSDLHFFFITKRPERFFL